MRTEEPRAIRLKDYRAPDYRIFTVALDFRLDPDATRVSATLEIERLGEDNPLVLNGVAGESGATNLGPRSKELVKYTKILVSYWHARGVNPTPDLVTTSGSGYDPDISQQDAIVQIPMVSKATGISASKLRTLIVNYTHPAQWGFLGAQYIDVLQLNEGLAALKK